MIRRLLLSIFVLLAGDMLIARQLTAQQPARHPNIVWIVGENFDLDFGCYGAKNVSTPNVDRLASGGVRFTHAYSTSPVCRPQSFGVHDRHVCDDHGHASHAVAPR